LLAAQVFLLRGSFYLPVYALGVRPIPYLAWLARLFSPGTAILYFLAL